MSIKCKLSGAVRGRPSRKLSRRPESSPRQSMPNNPDTAVWPFLALCSRNAARAAQAPGRQYGHEQHSCRHHPCAAPRAVTNSGSTVRAAIAGARRPSKSSCFWDMGPAASRGWRSAASAAAARRARSRSARPRRRAINRRSGGLDRTRAESGASHTRGRGSLRVPQVGDPGLGCRRGWRAACGARRTHRREPHVRRVKPVVFRAGG